VGEFTRQPQHRDGQRHQRGDEDQPSAIQTSFGGFGHKSLLQKCAQRRLPASARKIEERQK
jgi:hypothetical protein